MISMSDWFARRQAGQVDPPRDGMTPDDPAQIGDGGAAEIQIDPVANAYERGVRDGEAAAGHAAEERVREILEQWQQRLAEAEQDWAQRMAEMTVDCVIGALQTLRAQLDESVCAVLTPLLDEVVTRRATDQLLALTEQEMALQGATLIEIRAPLALHGHLRDCLSAAGHGATIVADRRVTVAGRDGTAVFEAMAGRWMAQVRGELP